MLKYVHKTILRLEIDDIHNLLNFFFLTTIKRKTKRILFKIIKIILKFTRFFFIKLSYVLLVFTNHVFFVKCYKNTKSVDYLKKTKKQTKFTRVFFFFWLLINDMSSFFLVFSNKTEAARAQRWAISQKQRIGVVFFFKMLFEFVQWNFFVLLILFVNSLIVELFI